MTEPRWLDRRIGRAGPYLTLCLSEAEFRAALKHLKSPEMPRWVSPNADATTHTFDSPDNGDPCCIVCVRGHEGRNGVEVAGMLIHEAVHVWQQWCDTVGERNPGSEQEAYAIQAISQELMSEFARRMA